MTTINVPDFKPEDEVRLYIPFAGDELLLTRDWTFTIDRTGGFHLLDAMGKCEIKKQSRTSTYGSQKHTHHWVEKTVSKDISNKITVTLVAGCVIALDKIKKGYGPHGNDARVSLRVTFHPKEQGFRNRTCRPRFELLMSELNNKVYFLPCSEPDVEFEEGFEKEVKGKKKKKGQT